MRSRWATVAPNMRWYHSTTASRSCTAMPTWSSSVSFPLLTSAPPSAAAREPGTLSHWFARSARSRGQPLDGVGHFLGDADDGDAGLGVLVHLLEGPPQVLERVDLLVDRRLKDRPVE